MRIIQAEQDRIGKIADMDEIAFHRLTIRIKHKWYSAILDIFIGPLGAYQVTPSRPTKDVFAKGQGVFEVILFHDPWRSQATTGQVVLDEILFQHHSFQDFRERIAAGIRAVLLLLRDGT